MPARLPRGAITPISRYVCPSCRPQNASLARGQTRYLHTAPPANVPGHTNQETTPKDFGGQNDSTSRSSIGDTIQGFMFTPDEKDKEPKGDSGNESHEQSATALKGIPSIAPQPEDSTDVLQRKLQQKFAAQRREDILAMQTSQASKTTEEFKEVSKARPVRESTKQSPKKRSTRARRAQQKRIEKAALAKEVVKVHKGRRAKSIDLAQNKVAKIATPTQPSRPEKSPTSISANAGRTQKIPEVGGKEVGKTDSDGIGSGNQMAIAQKLDDIMDILESSKKPEKPEKPENSVKRARSIEIRSTESELKRVVAAMTKELRNRGESRDINSREVIATILRSSSRLLARLKPNSRGKTRSFDQSKLHILLEQALRENDSQTRKATDNSSSSSSMEAQLSESPSKESYRKCLVRKSTGWQPDVMSLREALGQKSGTVKDADIESLQPSPSENIIKPLASPKYHLRRLETSKGSPMLAPEKTRKSLGSLRLPIAVATASDLELLPVTVDQPPVPRLAYGLERVLFNSGVYELQDPRSRVYNFDPYLQKIMPIAEFDFNALKEYITSSRDESLNKIAKEHGKRYMGSTSSMTEVLSHFHFLLSQWRDINPSMLSKRFPATNIHFTEFQRTPSAVFLRWKDGSYAIDADKEFDSSSVLSMLGKSMEKLLTLSTDDFERYRKSNSDKVTEEERFAPESYHYSTLGDFLMRSQLDAHDPRLPGTGMFDLKTRSVVSIRMDVANYEYGMGYEIKRRQGEWESYEREYYDMIRAAFLKYSLQVRMGRMDGIFVAFHNIERIFGFQYISLPEMDCTVHGQQGTSIGDQEFKLSLDLLNKVLDRATKKYPETSLRIFFETRDAKTPFMYVFAEPVTEEQVAEIQSKNMAKIQAFERNILGLTRGNSSRTDDAHEFDPKWEKIQADVQKAMEKDELFDDGSGQDQEAIDEGAEVTEYTPNRPEVLEHGPLYAGKSVADADDDVFAASAANEEDEGDDEDEDDTDGEGECENEEEDEEIEEKGDVDVSEEVEGGRWQEGPEDLLEGEMDINAIDAIEAERGVDGDGTDEKYAVKVQNTTKPSREELNEDDTPGATFGQQSINDTSEPMDDEQYSRALPDVEFNAIAEGEGEQKRQFPAGQRLPDPTNQEGVQADTTAISSPSEDMLAMTLTIRNKVNGKDVLRPVNMVAEDEWSIEYSLTEVPTQAKARALYNACQLRRRKKMEPRELEGVVEGYIERLRQLSRKGRMWRKQQDKKDRQRPVQVLSESGREGDASHQEP